MVVILVLAGLAILGGVVLAALGRAGEMATFPADHAPVRTGDLNAADVALLRPPMALWGYQVQATEEALQVIARSVTARDATIAALRRELDDLGGERPQPVTGGAAGEHTWPPPDAGDSGQGWPLEDADSDQAWPLDDAADSDQAWPLDDADVDREQAWPAHEAPADAEAWPAAGDAEDVQTWPVSPGYEGETEVWPAPGQPRDWPAPPRADG